MLDRKDFTIQKDRLHKKAAMATDLTQSSKTGLLVEPPAPTSVPPPPPAPEAAPAPEIAPVPMPTPRSAPEPVNITQHQLVGRSRLQKIAAEKESKEGTVMPLNGLSPVTPQQDAEFEPMVL